MAPQSVTSADGTRIGYRTVGEGGPAAILVHGGMESSADHVELAERLAARFTVLLPDRRGRGLSEAFKPGAVTPQEVADIQALVAASGAERIFGISSGAIAVLAATAQTPQLTRVAVMEPPLPVDGRWVEGWTPERFLDEYERRLTDGHAASAQAFAMKVTQMGPPAMWKAPESLLRLGTSLAWFVQDSRRPTDGVTLRALAPTLVQDTRLIIENQWWTDLGSADADWLVLTGEQSPGYLKRSTEHLLERLPEARLVTIEGAAHGASGNANRGGRPGPFSEALAAHFAAPGSAP